MRLIVRAGLVAVLFSLIAARSHAFDYDRYQPERLDAILDQQRPKSGLHLLPPHKLRFEVQLAAYAEDCDTNLLRTAMMMSGASKESVGKTLISKCVKVKSPQGQTASMYIQDRVAACLPEEVPLDAPLTVFVDYLFVDENGPGILVNEFESAKR